MLVLGFARRCRNVPMVYWLVAQNGSMDASACAAEVRLTAADSADVPAVEPPRPFALRNGGRSGILALVPEARRGCCRSTQQLQAHADAGGRVPLRPLPLGRLLPRAGHGPV